MLNQFFDKEKRTDTYVTHKNKGNKNRADFLNAPFASEGQSFFLHGHQYNYTETVPIGKANHHRFYLFMRTI